MGEELTLVVPLEDRGEVPREEDFLEEEDVQEAVEPQGVGNYEYEHFNS